MKTDYDYNSQRPNLVIREYGRNVQRMVDFCCTLEDREERNKVAQAIIHVIGQLNPHLRDVDDFKHKLWDHLYIMSDYKLDVDSPFPMPEKEVLEAKPKPLPYPKGKIKIGHYGKIVQDLIEAAKSIEDEEEKEELILLCVNLMKRHYVNWNRDSVEDEVILKDFEKLADGELKLKDPSKITPIQELVRTKPPQQKRPQQKRRSGGHQNRRRRS